ncbi:MAG: PilN domain-containing protein [Psychrilyobacter sp.]|uniref:PilN domain-containing protein n=1 Tax=Psychrilyobacter sp. TaxID=2586924 RepID=UPI003C71F068
MNQMNFLTKKYKNRLEIEEYFRKCLGIFIGIFLIIYLTSFGVERIEESVQKKISIEKVEIAEKNKRIKELTINSEKETNLGVEIEIIEDIFSQKNLRVSEIFHSLDENVPKNVWINSLIYEGKVVRIKGFSFKDNQLKSSEDNAYFFEERMLDSKLYKSVTLNYLKKASKYGGKINEFEYILVLK